MVSEFTNFTIIDYFNTKAPPTWANITLSVVDADTEAHLSGVELRIEHENGSWAQNLNFSSPGFFSGELYGFTAGHVTITARKSGYQDYSGDRTLSEGANEITVQMVPIAPAFDPWSYDFNGDGYIDDSERLKAVADHYAGIITRSQLDQVLALPSPPAPPTPPPGCIPESEKLQAIANYYAGLITRAELDAILAIPTCPSAAQAQAMAAVSGAMTAAVLVGMISSLFGMMK